MRFGLIAFLLTLVGCTESAEEAAGRLQYACPGQMFSVQPVASDRVVLERDRTRWSLPAVRSASGARYAADEVEFWDKGRIEAMITVDGTTHAPCILTSPLPDAGNHWRLQGNEPAWMVRLRDGQGAQRLQFVFGIGEPTVVQTDSIEHRRTTDGTRIYVAPSADLEIRLRADTCRDSMSGERHAWMAEVIWQDQTLRGCGDRQEGDS